MKAADRRADVVVRRHGATHERRQRRADIHRLCEGCQRNPRVVLALIGRDDDIDQVLGSRLAAWIFVQGLHIDPVTSSIRETSMLVPPLLVPMQEALGQSAAVAVVVTITQPKPLVWQPVGCRSRPRFGRRMEHAEEWRLHPRGRGHREGGVAGIWRELQRAGDHVFGLGLIEVGGRRRRRRVDGVDLVTWAARPAASAAASSADWVWDLTA